ncbi:hypothetical protein DPMN_030183 [Dreissena polymorpha]|uniref:Uncharacterized protein n=1 Tax=Dreissena polymorpha TaxID=45954 RepID=A0A9D4RGW2_DREPO|nr:hypothetical protein DPMN_030183 [Dreissena polymorpha]
MKGTSWTLAAPFKEQKFHRTPSESIANNYTPSASDLKMKDLPKLQRAKIPGKSLLVLVNPFMQRLIWVYTVCQGLFSRP